MKNTIKIFALVVAMIVLATLVVACNPAEETTKFTVTFDADGGTPAPAAQQVNEGEKATKPQDPTKEGFTFLGWFNGDTKYTFEEKVTANITLKAKWQAEGAEPETATTQEITYTTTIRGTDVSIKLALTYEVVSHKITEVVLGECTFTTGGNYEEKWEAGKETAIASYVGKTLEEVAAIEAPAGDSVVTGTTLTSKALLAAVQMAAETIIGEKVESDVNVTLPELQDGYAYLVIYEKDNAPCTVMSVKIADLENAKLITMLNYLKDNNGLHLVAGDGEWGPFVNEIGNLKNDSASGTYLYFYTTVTSDFDTSAYVQTIKVGGYDLTSSGVGVGEMKLESKCIIYVGLITY